MFSTLKPLYLSILSLLLLPLFIAAQEISISADQKLSGRTPRFSILGKNSEGIIIYKYGRRDNVIEVYNNNMHLKWEKDIAISSDAFVEKLIMHDNAFLLFYFLQKRNDFILMAAKLDRNLNPLIEETVIDTFTGNREDILFNIQITVSEDKQHILIYKAELESNEAVGIKYIGIDKNLVVNYKKEAAIQQTEEPANIKSATIDNKGNAYFFVSRGDEENRRKNTPTTWKIHIYNREADLHTVTQLPLKHNTFRNPHFDVDNANNQLVITGFYADDEKNAAEGMFYMIYDINANTVAEQNFEDFPTELIYKITGKDSAQNQNLLYSFEVTDVILRYDGGAIVIAESNFDNSESIEMPSFAPSASPSFRTVRITYYNDIIVFSVNPDASIDWYTILRKKQISEDDEGFYSSYSLALAEDKLHFIYNEEIYFKTNINQYTVNASGEVSRVNLFNAANQDVMLVPRLGKQVSSNELIIPSFKRNSLSFVKFTY